MSSPPQQTSPNNNNNTPQFDDTLFNTPPFLPTTLGTTDAIWIERQRRQRTLRIFMMFLMLLLLMDGDEQQQAQRERQRKEYHNSLRKSNKSTTITNNPYKVKKNNIYKERRDLDLFIGNYIESNPTLLNDDNDYDKNDETEKEIHVYPRNVTGYYRGEWNSITDESKYYSKVNNNNYLLNPKMNHNKLGISLLPPGYTIAPHNTTSNNTNTTNEEVIKSKFTNEYYKLGYKSPSPKNQKMTLTSKSGRIAFQMYMKSIAGMSEVYYIDGFIKIYDGVSPNSGGMTKRDLLLRSHGLYIPSSGLISLVANSDVDRSVFYLPNENKDSADDYEYDDIARRLNTTSRIIKSINDEWANFKSNYNIIPFPYVPVDNDSMSNNNLVSTTSNMRKGNTRILPLREQALQSNAASCEFEINLNVLPIKTSPSKQESLERTRTNFINSASPNEKNTQAVIPPKELLVSSFSGIIHSTNCNYYSNVTANALRIDWESTTGKAINYSFYMMLTCLTQIVVLLRQLLHTQAQSAACRVSLLCIGWQTLLDAILCIGHVLLCLMMQPLFTAFASVAFFKLLIFCVIEMKYMAIILQARYNASHQNAHNNQERMRQLIAQLHVRFYMCLFTTLMIIWYVGSGPTGNKGDTSSLLVVEVLVLYSFWIPQIIQNIITEAKRPLHLHYIYGMTVTRMIAPMYIFGFKTNFLKEVNPDFPIHPSLCFYIFVWLVFQAGVLICQGKYGARFMIPARFLPPKFDYSRPIPSSLLPLQQQSSDTSSLSDISINTTNTARIRHTSHHNTTASNNTLDCVICYNPIDIHDNRRYMLAPCDHIFHRNCLEQWMDVKMECPICRMDLPPI